MSSKEIKVRFCNKNADLVISEMMKDDELVSNVETKISLDRLYSLSFRYDVTIRTRHNGTYVFLAQQGIFLPE